MGPPRPGTAVARAGPNDGTLILFEPHFLDPTGTAGLASRCGLLEQLAELDLRGPFGLACLAEPDLAARQRVGTGVHLHTPGSAGESLYVSGWSSSHDITAHG